jgi:ribosomal-protein-alanine N-acetyltransferase
MLGWSGPTITDGEITLRLMRARDEKQWNRVREINYSWLNPWEGTRPKSNTGAAIPEIPSFRTMVHNYRKEAKAKRNISLGIWLTKQHEISTHNSPSCKCQFFTGEPELIGQITLGGIVFGALHGAHIGYWIDQNHSGRGYMARSVNALTQYAFNELALHRIEINIRPENESSIKVANNAGYIYEGDRPKFLHIDGQWRDHKVFVKTNPRIF